MNMKKAVGCCLSPATLLVASPAGDYIWEYPTTVLDSLYRLLYEFCLQAKGRNEPEGVRIFVKSDLINSHSRSRDMN